MVLMKFIIIILIISLISLIDINCLKLNTINSETNLIFKRLSRRQRQIVQPTWLTNTDISENQDDGVVKVTSENLRETAEIRQIIQDAVKNDQFAVDVMSDGNNMELGSPPSTAQGITQTNTEIPQLPGWQIYWQIPAATPQTRTVTDLTQNTTNVFMEDMQTRWLEFLQYSSQFFNMN